MVTVGRFRLIPGVEALLRRIGAISELAGMRYWSATHKRWQLLIVDAYALSGPDGDRRRRDFSPNEIEEGEYLYFHQEDNLSGKANYRLRILSASPDRLVFDTENISTIRYWLMPLFRAGEMQSIYFLERESQDVWCYYSITRTGKEASTLTAGHDASFINRTVRFLPIPGRHPHGQGAPSVAMNWLACNVLTREFPLINRVSNSDRTSEPY